MNNETAIENEITAKGLNAPRLNPTHIDGKIARKNARNKIWALEGYLLREKLSG